MSSSFDSGNPAGILDLYFLWMVEIKLTSITRFHKSINKVGLQKSGMEITFSEKSRMIEIFVMTYPGAPTPREEWARFGGKKFQN